VAVQCPATGTGAGRSTDFNSLVHPGRFPRFRAPTVRPGDRPRKCGGGHVDNCRGGAAAVGMP